MNKNKLLSKLLSTIEKLENFSKIINKKINRNKLSKQIEFFLKRKKSLLNFLNYKRNSKIIKTIFNKRINLPKLLTTDRVIKEVKELIKTKHGFTSQNNKDKEKTKKQNPKSIFKINFRIKDILANRNIIEKFTLSLNKIKQIKNPLIKHTINLDKDSHDLAVLVYNEHFLTLASVIINSNNKVFIKGVIEVPIPGDVIGDSCVEDKNELANIILDLLNLLKLEKSPILLILSSSFFQINTFLSSELRQISNIDNTVKSKSPYLPNDTFIEFRNIPIIKQKNKLVRTIYTSRKLIESWTDTLEILNAPIIGITPSAPHIFDIINNKISEKTSILIDIERNTTMVIVARDSINLTSHKIPYGSSLYSSDDNPELSKNYFSRLLLSLDLIISEYDEDLPSSIFIYGRGLDDLVKQNTTLPIKFKRLSEIKLANYSYLPHQMQIHELASKSIDSTIETLSLITSCL